MNLKTQHSARKTEGIPIVAYCPPSLDGELAHARFAFAAGLALRQHLGGCGVRGPTGADPRRAGLYRVDAVPSCVDSA